MTSSTGSKKKYGTSANKKGIAFEVNNEMELSENLLKDFNNNNNLNNKNIAELNNYGEEILSQTQKEVLNLKNDI